MSIPDVYILSGPVYSGKTTSLLNWSAGRADVHGILTPVESGRRYFLDISTREQWPMEASTDETEILTVGRFAFSRPGFDRAISLLRASVKISGWLVIDEIGPLELRGEGFGFIIQDILKERKGKTLLVVREGLVEEVVKSFRISGATIMSDLLKLEWGT